jgi:hypothetical protein
VQNIPSQCGHASRIRANLERQFDKLVRTIGQSVRNETAQTREDNLARDDRLKRELRFWGRSEADRPEWHR